METNHPEDIEAARGLLPCTRRTFCGDDGSDRHSISCPAVHRDAVATALTARRRERDASADYDRVIAWCDSDPRKPADLAFTAGPERQLAYRIEAAERTAADATAALRLAWKVIYDLSGWSGSFNAAEKLRDAAYQRATPPTKGDEPA